MRSASMDDYTECDYDLLKELKQLCDELSRLDNDIKTRDPIVSIDGQEVSLWSDVDYFRPLSMSSLLNEFSAGNAC